MKKGLMILAILLTVVSVWASDLYNDGYQKGYQDAIYGISYFVSPTMGQPKEWVDGYNAGFAKGLKEKMAQANASGKDRVATFKEELNQVVDLYQAVSFNHDEQKLNQLMAKSENVFDEIRMNVENDIEDAQLAKGVLLDKYVAYLENMDTQARDAFLHINKKLLDYLNYRLMVVREKGSRFEMKYYEDMIRKIQFLVGRGI